MEKYFKNLASQKRWLGGFTLIELIISVAILIIIAGGGIFVFYGYYERNELTVAMRGIIAAIRDVQARAITNESGTPWGIRFTNNAAEYYYEIFKGANYAASGVVSTKYLSNRLIFTEPPSASTTDIIFDVRTADPLATGTVTVALKRNTSTWESVTVFDSGRIKPASSHPAPYPTPSVAYEGFGAQTPGGSGMFVVHVTNLNDSGSGSFREALSAGNRSVVFDVGGEIELLSPVQVKGSFVTIDGFTAPYPGITLVGNALYLHGADTDVSERAHDIIIRGIRIRDSVGDGITIAGKQSESGLGAYNIVIDHVSVHNSFDENIAITFDSHDITLSNSIISGNGDDALLDSGAPHLSDKNVLISYNPWHITLHHNLFVEQIRYNPQMRVAVDDIGVGEFYQNASATDITVDMRNNVVWRWPGGSGSYVWYGPWVNIVDNYFSDSDSAIVVVNNVSPISRAYIWGNVSGDGVPINGDNTEAGPFAAPAVTTVDACSATEVVLGGVGVQPYDDVDDALLDEVIIRGC